MTSPNEFFPFIRVRRHYGNCLWKLYEICFLSMGIMGIYVVLISNLWKFYGISLNAVSDLRGLWKLFEPLVLVYGSYADFYKCYFSSTGVMGISLNAA